MNDIASRLAEIRAQIEQACARAGRDPANVTLVGASKGQPADRLREAHAAGLAVFGENRVQEAAGKQPYVPGVEWHLLGPLQSNKVRAALELFTTFHALDRPKILAAVAAEAERQGRELAGFVEVNLGDEGSKHGFPPQGLVE